MRQFEIKLSEWHRLYNELGTVERELADALLHGAHEQTERLRQRSATLTKESQAALEALNAAIATSKNAPARR